MLNIRTPLYRLVIALIISTLLVVIFYVVRPANAVSQPTAICGTETPIALPDGFFWTSPILSEATTEEHSVLTETRQGVTVKIPRARGRKLYYRSFALSNDKKTMVVFYERLADGPTYWGPKGVTGIAFYRENGTATLYPVNDETGAVFQIGPEISPGEFGALRWSKNDLSALDLVGLSVRGEQLSMRFISTHRSGLPMYQTGIYPMVISPSFDALVFLSTEFDGKPIYYSLKERKPLWVGDDSSASYLLAEWKGPPDPFALVSYQNYNLNTTVLALIDENSDKVTVLPYEKLFGSGTVLSNYSAPNASGYVLADVVPADPSLLQMPHHYFLFNPITQHVFPLCLKSIYSGAAIWITEGLIAIEVFPDLDFKNSDVLLYSVSTGNYSILKTVTTHPGLLGWHSSH